jgi:dTDP-glucose pyrophosphorylase/CBS domain-containing protein
MKGTIALASKSPRVNTATLFLHESASIAEVVACIDRSARVSIALVVDENDRLINTLSDGDVRRGIMAGLKLSDCVASLLQIKARTPHPLPVTALVGTDDETLLEIMQARAVRQIPLVSPHGRAVDIVTIGDLRPEVPRALQAVVMAGGEGRRLRPLTDVTPKPMLPVGGRPLMELIVDQLREVGVRKLNIATHYQAQKIIDHFGNGSSFGVDIEYTREEAPLGTGGALGLMTPPTDPVLVINGDILTDIDFRAMHAFHQEHGAQMTVAVRRYEVQVPYGVVECDGVRLVGLREKPELNFFVNAGIYLLEPSVYRHIPPGEHLNMTDLIDLLVASGDSVVSFPVREYWLDIGQHADYERAQRDAVNGKWLPGGPTAVDDDVLARYVG